MVKTAPMDNRTHTFFKKTQAALFEKYKISLSISDIMTEISYALHHPDDAAKIIMRARHKKHENVISSEDGSDNNGGDIQKSLGIELVEKDDMKT
jgi:hypothetical protein